MRDDILLLHAICRRSTSEEFTLDASLVVGHRWLTWRRILHRVVKWFHVYISSKIQLRRPIFRTSTIYLLSLYWSVYCSRWCKGCISRYTGLMNETFDWHRIVWWHWPDKRIANARVAMWAECGWQRSAGNYYCQNESNVLLNEVILYQWLRLSQ